MSKLIYFMPTSLDGFIAGENDDLNWSVPDEEVSIFMNDLLRPIGTYLCGRKMYETMKIWETPDAIPGLTPDMLDFAEIWQAGEKIVYSRTLETVSTKKTRLVREFDLQAVRDMKSQLPQDILVEGPNLAAQAIRAGLIDEYHLFIVPFVLGAGIRVLPNDVRIELHLLDEHRFGNGWVYLHYRAQV